MVASRWSSANVVKFWGSAAAAGGGPPMHEAMLCRFAAELHISRNRSGTHVDGHWTAAEHCLADARVDARQRGVDA